MSKLRPGIYGCIKDESCCLPTNCGNPRDDRPKSPLTDILTTRERDRAKREEGYYNGVASFIPSIKPSLTDPCIHQLFSGHHHQLQGKHQLCSNDHFKLQQKPLTTLKGQHRRKAKTWSPICKLVTASHPSVVAITCRISHEVTARPHGLCLMLLWQQGRSHICLCEVLLFSIWLQMFEQLEILPLLIIHIVHHSWQ